MLFLPLLLMQSATSRGDPSHERADLTGCALASTSAHPLLKAEHGYFSIGERL
jgi:hypothetical protein